MWWLPAKRVCAPDVTLPATHESHHAVHGRRQHCTLAEEAGHRKVPQGMPCVVSCLCMGWRLHQPPPPPLRLATPLCWYHRAPCCSKRALALMKACTAWYPVAWGCLRRTSLEAMTRGPPRPVCAASERLYALMQPLPRALLRPCPCDGRQSALELERRRSRPPSMRSKVAALCCTLVTCAMRVAVVSTPTSTCAHVGEEKRQSAGRGAGSSIVVGLGSHMSIVGGCTHSSQLLVWSWTNNWGKCVAGR